MRSAGSKIVLVLYTIHSVARPSKKIGGVLYCTQFLTRLLHFVDILTAIVFFPKSEVTNSLITIIHRLL